MHEITMVIKVCNIKVIGHVRKWQLVNIETGIVVHHCFAVYGFFVGLDRWRRVVFDELIDIKSGGGYGKMIVSFSNLFIRSQIIMQGSFKGRMTKLSMKIFDH